MLELKQEFQDRILFGFLEGIWCLDIIYQGQRPSAEIQETDREETDQLDDESAEAMEKEKISNTNTEDQESYKREFFSMLEDVIELSSDFPSVLLDPEFSLVQLLQKKQIIYPQSLYDK